MSFQSVDTMAQTPRITHIDSLRGAAVLLMVMVHAAATWNPFHTPQPSILAYTISGLGGLAAPLFVTLFGWGVVRHPFPLKQRLFQSSFLFATQIMVNLTSPHLFDPFTPGVLSLMALLTLLMPPFAAQLKKSGSQFLVLLYIAVFTLQLFFPEIQGTGEWNDRVSGESLPIFISNLLLTGTYPLFPWILFASLGAIISTQGDKAGASIPNSMKIKTSLVLGLAFCIITFYISDKTDMLWAHPTSEAMLTFFPANPAFIIAASTGVLLIWIAIQNLELHALNSAGRMSLTLYVIHFIPLTLTQEYESTYQWSLTTSSIAVVAYALIWIPLSAQWLKRYPKATLEATLKAIRKSL